MSIENVNFPATNRRTGELYSIIFESLLVVLECFVREMFANYSKTRLFSKEIGNATNVVILEDKG